MTTVGSKILLNTQPPIMNEEHQENSLTKDLESAMWDKTMDIGTEIADNTLEVILDNEATKEIPFIKSLVSFYKIYSSYQARRNVKKILAFLKEFKQGLARDEQINNFKRKFEQDNNHREVVLETLLHLNETFLVEEQSKILANLFIAHLEGNISWGGFNNLTFVLNSLNPAGYDFLASFHKAGKWYGGPENIQGESYMYACGIGHRFGTMFRITEAGQNLYIFGILPCRRAN